MDYYNYETDYNANNKVDISLAAKEKRNIILFSLGKLVSLLGTYIYSFAVSLYILKVTGSGTSFAFSILIGTLPRVLLGPVAGSFTDRVDRKKMIVLLDFLSGAVLLSLFTLSILYGLRLPMIYVATFLLAIISTFFNTGFAAAIPRLVSDKNLIKINSYNRAIDSGSQILGPILAGMVFGFVSMELFLIINGFSFIISAVSEIFINFKLCESEQEKVPEGKMNIKTIGHDIKVVFSFIHQHKLLSLIMPISMTSNFLITASLAVVLPYLINNTLGMNPTQYGIIECAFSIGMLLAAFIISRLPEKAKKRRGLAIGIIGMGLSLIVMGVPGIEIFESLDKNVIFAIYIPMAILFAYFVLSIDLPMAVVVQRSIPDHMMGRVMGVWGTIASGLSPIGIILAGITLDIIPAYIIFFIAGTYFVITSIIIFKGKIMQDY